MFLFSHYFIVYVFFLQLESNIWSSICFLFSNLSHSASTCIEVDTELEIKHRVSQGVLMDTEAFVLENGSVFGFMADWTFMRIDH